VRAPSLTIVALLGRHLACAAEETGEVAVVEIVAPAVKTFREGLSLLEEAEETAVPETKGSKYRETIACRLASTTTMRNTPTSMPPGKTPIWIRFAPRPNSTPSWAKHR
jgi:hypothetical protein